jgi:tetratricopeptide (TPR) repeat protein
MSPSIAPALPGASPAPVRAVLRQTSSENIAALTAPISFLGSSEMVRIFLQDKDYMKVVDLGISALRIPQSRASLEALLYFLAEARFKLEELRSVPASTETPDWIAAQTYYTQAVRFAPTSPWHPLALYRLSQIAGYLNSPEEEMARLKLVQSSYPDSARVPEVMLDIGKASLAMYDGTSSSSKTVYARTLLAETSQTLQQYLAKYSDGGEGQERAQVMLGCIAYHQGDNEQAYGYLQGKKIPIELHEASELRALAAHKVKKVDLTNPKDEGEKRMLDTIKGSLVPRYRLELARLFEDAGAIRDALFQYEHVASGNVPGATADDVEAANRAMARIALQDLRLNREPQALVEAEAYTHPVEKLKKMVEDTFSLRPRAEILGDLVQQLVARGQEQEAIQLAMPFLKESVALKKINAELLKDLEGAVPQALQQAQKDENALFAYQISEVFAPYLDTLPQKDDHLLVIAQMLLNAGLREQANKTLDRMSPYPNLTPSQQASLTMLRREIRLDPTRPDIIKQEAPGVLETTTDPFLRARVLKLLADVSAKEGEHEHAAKTLLKAAAIKELGWRQRLGFQEAATRQYNAAGNSPKVLETAWQGLRDFESAGIPLSEGAEPLEYLLLLLAQNFEKLGDYPKAATAYEQYLQNFPQGLDVQEVRFRLAGVYEQNGQPKKALDMFDTITTATIGDKFWGTSAQKAAEHLRWKSDKAAVLQKK